MTVITVERTSNGVVQTQPIAQLPDETPEQYMNRIIKFIHSFKVDDKRWTLWQVTKIENM